MCTSDYKTKELSQNCNHERLSTETKENATCGGCSSQRNKKQSDSDGRWRSGVGGGVEKMGGEGKSCTRGGGPGGGKQKGTVKIQHVVIFLMVAAVMNAVPIRV